MCWLSEKALNLAECWDCRGQIMCFKWKLAEEEARVSNVKQTTFFYNWRCILLLLLWNILREVFKKKLWKSGQADRWALTAWPFLFVKILGHFSIWFLGTQNRFYFIVKRLKNAVLMYFYCLSNCPKTAKTVNISKVSLGASKGIFGGQKIFFW